MLDDCVKDLIVKINLKNNLKKWLKVIDRDWLCVKKKRI